MKIKKNIRSASLAFVLCASFIGNTVCGSADVFAIDQQAEYRMDITPTQKGLGDIEPDTVYTGSFELRNEGKQDFDFEISFSPYAVLNEEYDQIDYSAASQYTEITEWISVDKKSGSLKSGERTTINYSVDVPSDAHGGAQVGVIMLTMLNNNAGENTGVQTIRQLGYLIYGNVDGTVTKTGKVLEHKVPSFLFNPPITATSVVENTGNVYTAAKYSLQVFPLFSDEEVYTNEEEPDKNIIFPETKRLNQISWEGAPQLGIFRVRSTVKIFDEESVVEKLVFLCPIWFLFIVLLLIFCMIFWIVSRVFKRKKEA